MSLLTSNIVDLSIVQLGKLLLHGLESLSLSIRVALGNHFKPLALVSPSSGWQVVEETIWKFDLLLLDLARLDVWWQVVLLEHLVGWVNGR